MSFKRNSKRNRGYSEKKLMTKTKNDPRFYIKREVKAPNNSSKIVPKLDSDSLFFVAPLNNGYLDFEFFPQDKKKNTES